MATDDETRDGRVDFELLYYGVLALLSYLLGNSAADWGQTEIELASVGPAVVPWSPGLLFAGLVLAIYVGRRVGRKVRDR